MLGFLSASNYSLTPQYLLIPKRVMINVLERTGVERSSKLTRKDDTVEVIRMKDVEGKLNRRGVSAKLLLQNDHVRVMNLNLRPGDTVPEHSVPVEVFFYVVEGRGTIKIGEETAIVEATDIVICPKNVIMAVYADQGENFSVLNVKTPDLPH